MLSLREREILQLVAEGLTSEDIASRLFISIKTVSTHRRHIMKKINLKSVAELTRYAISEGLVSLD
jgi:DNA-binding CsgD family transcriptional regulator